MKRKNRLLKEKMKELEETLFENTERENQIKFVVNKPAKRIKNP